MPYFFSLSDLALNLGFLRTLEAVLSQRWRSISHAEKLMDASVQRIPFINRVAQVYLRPSRHDCSECNKWQKWPKKSQVSHCCNKNWRK